MSADIEAIMQQDEQQAFNTQLVEAFIQLWMITSGQRRNDDDDDEEGRKGGMMVCIN